MISLKRLRRREPSWRRAPMWVPAPQPVVGPEEAGIDPARLRMPAEFDRLGAPPVFITGSARSGTTWTIDIFGRHPEVCAITEPWILTQTHGLTSIFTQREWNPEASRNAVDRVGIRHAAVQLLPYEEMVEDVAGLVSRWLMRPVRQDQRFLAVKEPLDVHAAAVMFPESRFVHVIRDGRDVAVSMRSASETWDPSMGVGLPMAWRAEAWRRQVENVRVQRKHLGDRYLEIRYEDMRRDVARAARTLFDFARIPYDDALLGAVQAGTSLSSYGDKVRQSGFRGRGRVRGWRDAFTLREAVGFSQAAGDLLVELGYERDKRWWRRLVRRPI